MAAATVIGVLLVNLGTPDAPTPAAIRRYLREFLSDRRVVELPRLLWLPLLYGAILPLRPRRVAPRYRAIWSERGSPLLALSQDLARAVEQALGGDVAVRLAMRYGNPSTASVVNELLSAGVERLLVLPLYPQYSASTTASAFDAVAAALRAVRAVPELHFVRDYHDDAGYLAALAESVRAHWAAQGRGEHLLFSCHGVPQAFVDRGDPYAAQCRRTAEGLARALGLGDGDWTLSYQSRLGRAQWLQPYTEAVVRDLAARGVRQLDVCCPGFAVDCLETLEEIALRMRDRFVAAGGSVLRYIPALNAGNSHAGALAALVRRQLPARGAQPS